MTLKAYVYLTFMKHLNLHEPHFKRSVDIYGHCTGPHRFRMIKSQAGGSGQNHGEYQQLNEVGVEEQRCLVGSWEDSGQEKEM